jgi:hypothetical protein
VESEGSTPTEEEIEEAEEVEEEEEEEEDWEIIHQKKKIGR